MESFDRLAIPFRLNWVLLLVAAFSLAAVDVTAQLPPDSGEPGCPDYVWIDFGREIREKSGALTRQYHLRLAGSREDGTAFQCSDIDDWQPRCRLSDRSRSNPLPDGPLPGDNWYYVPMACEAQDGTMAITTPVATRLQLVVTGSCVDRQGRHQYVAQTDQSLIGRAASARQTERTPAEPPSEWMPMLYLQPSRTNYYMQTGLPYYFSFSGDIDSYERLVIIEDGQRLPQGARPSVEGTLTENTFSYTSMHDRRLERSGPHAVKTLVLLLETLSGVDHQHTTFSLQLHRSITANIKPRAGALLFGIAAFLTLSAVLVYRRLQNTQW